MLLPLRKELRDVGGVLPARCPCNNYLRFHGLVSRDRRRSVAWALDCGAIGSLRLRCQRNDFREFSHRLRVWQPQNQRKGCRLITRSQRAASGGEQPGQQPGRSVHFIGIGGAGISALAFLALKQGWQVSGSDASANDRMEALRGAGATVYVGHAPSQVIDEEGLGRPNAVVVSSAIPRDNEELNAARKAGLPIYRRAEWLGMVTEDYELLAVAGSHGKSTTAAMLATVLHKMGDDVTAVVGAEVPQFPSGGNAIYGKGKRFVLEADEYDGCFLGVEPALAVVMNVEWEHVDMFPNEASVREIFKKFVLKIRPGGTLLVCGDSAGSKLLATVFQEEEEIPGSIGDGQVVLGCGQNKARRVLTFGLGGANDWQAVMLAPNVQGGTDYVAVHAGRPMARVSLQIPGTHNVLNSLAVVVILAVLGSEGKEEGDIEDELAKMKEAAEAAGKVLAQFVGVQRRFEFIGQAKGCMIYDDYAHHPTEVRAVLQAARQRFDRHSIWVVFQPHTYSRLASLLQDFAPAFSAADRVIVTEVYSAREENVWNISGADLTALITGPPAIFISSLENVVARLSWELTVFETMDTSYQKKVVLLTLGAGDVTKVGYQLLKEIQQPTT